RALGQAALVSSETKTLGRVKRAGKNRGRRPYYPASRGFLSIPNDPPHYHPALIRSDGAGYQSFFLVSSGRHVNNHADAF
ncbi:unnamed protein product, partial [marine sediment metagenome]